MLLKQHRQAFDFQRSITPSSFSSRALSTDPSNLVSGLTPEQVEADPQIAEFLRSNFDNDEEGDGFAIPPEILKDYGYNVPDISPDAAAAVEAEKYDYAKPKVDLGLGTPEQQAMNIRTLTTFLRTEEGTNACNRLRWDDMIPGMLYGSDSNQGILSLNKETRVMLKTPWRTLQRELDRFHRKFESRVYDLTIYEDESDTEGSVHRVVPRDVQRHPVQGSIYCSNFVRYHAGRPLKIPIVYINEEESPALKRDGYIVPINKFVECFVEDGAPIPEALELECTGLQLKEVVRMDRLIFPDGVRHTDRVDPEKFLIGPVFGGRSGGMDDDDADGEGGEKVEEKSV
jgi:large subunit ribosomal protein L25